MHSQGGRVGIFHEEMIQEKGLTEQVKFGERKAAIRVKAKGKALDLWKKGRSRQITEFLPLCHSRNMDFFKAFQVRSDSHFRKITLKDDRWIRRGKIKARVSFVTT